MSFFTDSTGRKPDNSTQSRSGTSRLHPDEDFGDELELANGTVLERYSSSVIGAEGEYYGRIWVFHDITERKPIENEIKQLQLKHLSVLNSAGEGIYGLDRSGKPTFVNPAALRLLGYGVAEIIGQPGHALIHHSYPDGRPYPIESCPIYLALRDGESHRKDDEVFWRRDGASFSVEYNSTPMHDQQGQIAFSGVVVFRDITQRKPDEQSLRNP